MMVIAAIALLSVIVTEFTYVTQVNQKMAYDSSDQLKAHYMAKTGLKISLLRLKAYQSVKKALSGAGGSAGASGLVPKQLLEKIWSFPFLFPIPTQIPGMSATQKEKIGEFQKESSLDGSFSAVIESESSKYNLNMILAPFAPIGASGASGPSGPPANPPGSAGASGPTAPSGPTFNVEAARESLQTYLRSVIEGKFQDDPDFQAEYRDLRIEDLADNIIAWADRTYERRTPPAREMIPPKGAPFYSVSELHMIDGVDDRIYNLLAPTLTASPTPGVNVNSIEAGVLKALVPGIQKEEVEDFFKFRDSDQEDNLFKEEKDFFDYLLKNIGGFRNDTAELRRYQEDLKKRNIRVVVDETNFKITVQANVNQATRTIEAWVTLGKPAEAGAGARAPRNSAPGAPPPVAGPPPTDDETENEASGSGLKITFMRLSFNHNARENNARV